MVGADGEGAYFDIDGSVNRVPGYICDPTGETVTAPKIISIRFLLGTGNACRTIGEYAFAYCNQAQTLICEGNVLSEIGAYAFYKCGLTAVTIPLGVQTIRESAFKDCVYVSRITLKAQACTVSDNVFQNVGNAASDGVSAGLTLDVGETVVEIPTKFIYDNASLRAINFPSEGKCRCEVIGPLAFGGCTGLTEVTMPNSLSTIGMGAFYRCTGLVKYTAPFIGGKSAALKAERSTLFGYIFHADIEGDDTTGMTKVSQSYNTGSIDYELYYIPDSIREVTITYYTNVYYGSFENCAYLTKVTINESTLGLIVDQEETKSVINGQQIGDKAFSGCLSLESYSVSDTLKEIGEEAFAGCSSLLEITIPKNVASIGKRAFADCKRVTKVYFNAKECADFASADNVFVGLGTTSVTAYIGNEVKRIPAYFFGCDYSDVDLKQKEPFIPKVTSMTLSTSNSALKVIGKYAFYDCSELSSIVLPSGIISIGRDAFFNTAYYDDPSKWTNCILYYRSGGSESYTYALSFDETKNNTVSEEFSVEDGTLLIADGAFSGSEHITSVILPKSIRYIGEEAFSKCGKLARVSFTEGEFVDDSSSLKEIGVDAFKACVELTEFKVTSKVENIGDGAFSGCTKLETVTIDSAAVCGKITMESAAGYLCLNAITNTRQGES